MTLGKSLESQRYAEELAKSILGTRVGSAVKGLPIQGRR